MKKQDKGEYMRLDKYISISLNLTRSESKKIITSKKIKVNQKVITKSDYNVEENDIVTYNDKEIIYEENIYIMMNKPAGYVCSHYDNRNKTIFDLISDYNRNRLSIVGRLDIDTEGLLLITSDGKLLHELTSPKKDKEKKYYVECEKDFTLEDIVKFKEGIVILLEDGEEYKCKEANLEIIDGNKAYITIKEGKFHQIKKMCERINNKVTYLERISIDSLTLDNSLNKGSYRHLTENEVKSLKK